MKFKSIISALGLTALLVGAPARAQEADWAKVLEAAKKEGSVALYFSADFLRVAKFNQYFESRYGIKVLDLFGRPSEIQQRLDAEQNSGRFLADVTVQADEVLEAIFKSGRAATLAKLPNESKAGPNYKRTNEGLRFSASVYTFVANNKLSPTDMPKSWRDLTSPKLVGRILSDDPRAQGAGTAIFSATYLNLGADYHKTMAQQKISMTRENGTIIQRVAIGEFDIGIPVCLCRYGQANGLPIKFVLAEEGVVYANWHVGMLKNAPHPNAALVYANALLDLEAQASFGNIGNAPIITGLDDKLDAIFRPFFNAKPLSPGNADDLAKAPQIAAGIYK